MSSEFDVNRTVRRHSKREAVIAGSEHRRGDRDPLAGSAWSRPATVEGFVHSPPNAVLLDLAARERHGSRRLLDIGCGAGRNALPLARAGWNVIATDLSLPMVMAAAAGAADGRVSDRLRVLLAPMDRLPFPSRCFDFIVAHGIWNLARSGVEFRRAVQEAARVARLDAGLFVFTFSRGTLEETATPVAGEEFVFTQFSGQPQCFLTEAEVLSELGAVGFEPDNSLLLHELNKRPPGALIASNAPVIWEGFFRFKGDSRGTSGPAEAGHYGSR